MEALDRAGLIYGLTEPVQDGGAPGAAAPAVVLRGIATDVARLEALTGAAAPRRRQVTPEPLRFLYLSRAHVGQRWFVRGIDEEIEPASFADALFAVEQLTLGAGEQWGAPLLVGHGQGGELALALAALMPELLAGVVALDAALPEVHGWERPATDAAGLPVLLLPAAQAGAETERTRAELTAIGARVTALASSEEAATLGPALDATIAGWWAAEGPDRPVTTAIPGIGNA